MPSLSAYGVTHPPRSNPPLRSSSGPPSPCITPSAVTIVMLVSFMIVPLSLVGRRSVRPDRGADLIGRSRVRPADHSKLPEHGPHFGDVRSRPDFFEPFSRDCPTHPDGGLTRPRVDFCATNGSRSEYPRPSSVIRCLHRLARREELDRAVRQIRSQLFAHLAEELAVNNGDRCKDGFGQVAKVLPVLDGRRGVPVPLDDHALGLVVVEVGLELQRSAVLGPHDLHGLNGQALVLLDLALVELEASDA